VPNTLLPMSHQILLSVTMLQTTNDLTLLMRDTLIGGGGS